MIFESITNRGEFFSNHYLDAVIGGDLGDLRATWKDDRGARRATPARSRIMGMRRGLLRRPRRRHRGVEVRPAPTTRCAELHDVVLDPLGFAPRADRPGAEAQHRAPGHRPGRRPRRDQHRAAAGRHRGRPGRLRSTTCSTTTRRLLHERRATRPAAVDPCCAATTSGPCRPQPMRSARSSPPTSRPATCWCWAAPWCCWPSGPSGPRAASSPSTSAGALERNDTKAKGELETIAALFSADALVPEALEGMTGQSLLEELVDELAQARRRRVQGAAQRHPREHRDPRQRGHRPARRPGPGPQPEALHPHRRRRHAS